MQQAAAQAVDLGLKEVDAQVNKLRTKRVKVGKNKFETKVVPGPIPQVALVALDPHTGEVLALVGGRNYGFSQLNHAVAKRPTGSIFKPFVYAAAMNNAVTNEQPIFTPASLVDDSPTAFINGDDVYTPRNYKEEYFGQVTAQFALAHSLNNATVKVAEMVGYDKVANLAKIAGISSVRATPAMALGSYDATPMEMASAYTIFSNDGQRITPIMVRSVRDANGDIIDNYQPQKTQVLDPRVAYVITDMLQGVINNGTAAGAAGVRARKFTAPAAGKTGTSHDGWFAGFTSNLLCIVWVGYDDYSDIHLSGAAIALPIWTEFMKRAVDLPNYSDTKPFTPPQGVVELTLDRATNQIATPACPDDYTTAFIDGTQPTQTCEQAGHGNVFQRIFGIEPKPTPTPSASNAGEREHCPRLRGSPPSGWSGSAPAACGYQTRRKRASGAVFLVVPKTRIRTIINRSGLRPPPVRARTGRTKEASMGYSLMGFASIGRFSRLFMMIALLALALPVRAQEPSTADSTATLRVPPPPENAEPAELEQQGDQLRGQKAYLDSIDYYRAAMKKDDSAVLHNKVGMCLLQLRRDSEAKKEFSVPSRRTRNTLRPITTWAPFITTPGNMVRPSGNTRRPSN